MSALCPKGDWAVIYFYDGQPGNTPDFYASREEAKAKIGTLGHKASAVIVEVRAYVTPLPVQHEWKERN